MIGFNRGSNFFLSRHSPLVPHHLVCRYANDSRVDIGIRESACDHADPLANEKATRFDNSYESSLRVTFVHDERRA